MLYGMGQHGDYDITIINAKKNLLEKQKEIQKNLRFIESSDPVMIDSVAESSELGTLSWQSTVHDNLEQIKLNLLSFQEKIKNALEKIRIGTYGRCKRCGKQIEPERLVALPMADKCMTCL